MALSCIVGIPKRLYSGKLGSGIITLSILLALLLVQIEYLVLAAVRAKNRICRHSLQGQKHPQQEYKTALVNIGNIPCRNSPYIVYNK